MTKRVRLTSAVLLLSAVPIFAACGSGSSGGSAAATKPPSAAPGAVPSDLAGVWHTRFQGADEKMKFAGTTYAIYTQPTDQAVGTVKATGHTITFSGSNTCSGSGTYTWQVDQGTLTFAATNHDPCPRATLLKKHAWTRVP